MSLKVGKIDNFSQHLISNPQNFQDAIKSGDSLRLNKVINGIPLDKPLPNGLLPLHFAVLENQPENTAILLEKGANPEMKDSQGLSAIDHAAKMKNPKMLSLLLGKTLSMYHDYINEQIKSPTSTYAVNQLKEKTDKLLNVNVKKLTPLCRAAFEGKLDEIRKIYTNGELNKWDAFGLSPIHYAILGNQTEALDLLISKRGDIKKYTSENDAFSKRENDSPLHLAALVGSKEMIQKLIDLGFDPNLKNKEGQTPLHYAAIRNKYPSIKFLITQGARPNVQDNHKICPLSLIGSTSLQKDPLTLTKTQVLLFAISVSYWLYYIAKAQGLEFGYATEVNGSPSWVSLYPAFEGMLFSADMLADFSSRSWLTSLIPFGALALGNAAFQALHTYNVVSSSLQGLKACWENVGTRNWKVARNVVVHSVNISSSLSSLWTVFNSLSYVKAFRLKGLSAVDRVLDPSLDPTKQADAALTLSAEFNYLTFKEKGMSYVNSLFREYQKKFFPDKIPNVKGAQAAFERISIAKKTLETCVKENSCVGDWLYTDIWSPVTEQVSKYLAKA